MTQHASLYILLLLLPPLCFSRGGSNINPYLSPVGSNCDPVDTSVTDAKLKSSIDKVVKKLVTKVVLTGFATASYGKNISAICGLLQCRADVSAQECAVCAKEAQMKLNKTCAKDGKARLWFERCYLRYDTENFIGRLGTMDFSIIYNDGPEVPNKNKKVFQAEVGKLLREVSAKAVAAGSRGRGMGETKISPNVTTKLNVTIYAMA